VGILTASGGDKQLRSPVSGEKIIGVYRDAMIPRTKTRATGAAVLVLVLLVLLSETAQARGPCSPSAAGCLLTLTSGIRRPWTCLSLALPPGLPGSCCYGSSPDSRCFACFTARADPFLTSPNQRSETACSTQLLQTARRGLPRKDRITLFFAEYYSLSPVHDPLADRH
jgi:hypothetical protein